jgi:hypothetical protein
VANLRFRAAMTVTGQPMPRGFHVFPEVSPGEIIRTDGSEAGRKEKLMTPSIASVAFGVANDSDSPCNTRGIDADRVDRNLEVTMKRTISGHLAGTSPQMPTWRSPALLMASITRGECTT